MINAIPSHYELIDVYNTNILNIKILTALGYTIEEHIEYYKIYDSTKTILYFFYKKDCLNSEEAWYKFINKNNEKFKFSTSYDACKPLIEEMGKFGEFVIHINFDKIYIEFFLKKQGNLLKTIACFEYECDATIDLIEAQTICYCNIYLQFKEFFLNEKERKIRYLTNNELQQLSSYLLHTSKNIYTAVEELFNFCPDEEIFEEIAKAANICQCDICSIWQSIDNLNDDIWNNICENCSPQ